MAFFHKKSKFSRKTLNKLKNKKYKNPTVLLHKDKKSKKSKPLRKIAKRIFRFNAPINVKWKIKKIGLLAALIALVLLLFYLLFFTQVFTIKNIIIFEGENESENVHIRKMIEPVREQNIFLLQKDAIATKLENNIENLAELKVQKVLPSTIRVSYAKFEDTANIVNLVGRANIRKNFIINETGILTSEGQKEGVPYIVIETTNAYELGDQVVNQERLAYITGAITYFEEKFNLHVVHAKYLNKAREARLVIQNDFEVWLDTQQSYETQLNKLKNAIPKIDIYSGNLAYVDLRIQSAYGQKIIFKEKQ